MNENKKHLTIKEAKNNMQQDINELELYLTKKRINFQKTQPKGTNYDKVVVSGTPISFDKFTHYVIRNEDYDVKIYSLMESINAWEKYIIDEMKRIYSNGGSELVVFLRDEMCQGWSDVSKNSNYSIRQCHNLYDLVKNQLASQD